MRIQNSIRQPAGKTKSSEAGYMLTEGIIASAIIATAVVGILALLASSLRIAQFSKSQLIASMLAQEGIEVVRAIRDANWIQGALFGCHLGSGDYQVEYNTAFAEPGVCAPPPFFTGSPIKFDSATGRYQYAVGVNTEFTRRIIIVNLDSSLNPGPDTDEIRVISRVSWTARSIPFAIDVEEHLFNWFQP